MSEKIILSDVDEVLLQWSNHFCKWASEEFGINKEPLKNVYQVHKWLEKHPDETDKIINHFNSLPGHFDVITPFPDAVQAVGLLKKRGYRFVAITACKNDSLTYELRKKNLESVFGKDTFLDIHCVGYVHTKSGKKETLQKYDPTWWVEDSWQHALAGVDVGHTPIVITREHNIGKDHPKITRVNNWMEIYRIITVNND